MVTVHSPPFERKGFPLYMITPCVNLLSGKLFRVSLHVGGSERLEYTRVGYNLGF